MLALLNLPTQTVIILLSIDSALYKISLHCVQLFFSQQTSTVHLLKENAGTKWDLKKN